MRSQEQKQVKPVEELSVRFSAPFRDPPTVFAFGEYSPLKVQFKSTLVGDIGGRRAVVVEGRTPQMAAEESAG